MPRNIFLFSCRPLIISKVVSALNLIVSDLGCSLLARDQVKFVVKPIFLSINLVERKVLNPLLCEMIYKSERLSTPCMSDILMTEWTIVFSYLVLFYSLA